MTRLILSEERMYLVILSIVIIFAFVILCNCKELKFGGREYYGGPVKKIRRIPKTTCYGNCDQYYKQCMAQFQGTDAGTCHNRFWNCITTCDYTDFHRL